MEPERRKKLSVFLPWALVFAFLAIFTVIGLFKGQGSSPLETRYRKLQILSTMRIQLLEAIEAEKNAVLAVTDKASEEFAVRARQADDRVENSRKEIESIIYQGKDPGETDLINEFNACWRQFTELDRTILDLATQNTNLKAQRISATQCAHEIDLFEASLNRLIQINTKDGQSNEVVVNSYKALTTALEIFVLHKPHIEEADDQRMDKIEQRMKSYEESARKALETLRRIPDLRSKEDLKNAESAFERFMSLTTEVIRLSRMNTNIKSVELSLGKERLISSKCQEILATLQKKIQTQGSKATK
jgi:hypothetical protein